MTINQDPRESCCRGVGEATSRRRGAESEGRGVAESGSRGVWESGSGTVVGEPGSRRGDGVGESGSRGVGRGVGERGSRGGATSETTSSCLRDRDWRDLRRWQQWRGRRHFFLRTDSARGLPPTLAIGSDVTSRAVPRNEPHSARERSARQKVSEKEPMPRGPSRKRVLDEGPLAWQGARQKKRRGTPEAVCRVLVCVILARGSVSEEQQ